MKNLLLILLVIVALSSFSQTHTVEYPHYQIKVSVNPAKQYINVECKWDLPHNPDNGIINFYLHRQLRLEEIELNGGESITISRDTSDVRYMPYATKYSVKSHNVKDKKTSLRLKYSGELTEWEEWSPSVIDEDWVELGSYFPWYPRYMGYGPFTYEVKVLIDEKYNTYMMGTHAADKGWASYVRQKPTNDIVLCASQKLKKELRQIYQYELCLAHSTFSDTLINSLTSDLRKILFLYNRWFPVSGNKFCLVESMRERGGGYARLGGIYLSGLTSSDYYGSRKAYTRYLAHEMSHLWWYRADPNTWEDWLNEGFAEYTALIVLREIYGQEYFQQWIDGKIEESEGTDPVWNYIRSGDQAYNILYNKTPLLLYELEQRIGESQFRKLMWNLLKNEVSTTYEFKRILNEQEGKETAEWFVQMLKEK